MLADLINTKIKKYWMILNESTIIVTILDPRNKILLFTLGESTTKAINALQEQFTLYLNQESQSQPQHDSQQDSTSP